MNKEELRRINKEKRKYLSKEEIKENSKQASDIFLDSDIYKNAKVIMLYYPLGNETDTAYIYKKAMEDNKVVAYPITNVYTNELKAVMVNCETEFSRGGYSVFEPNSDKLIDKKSIDVIIVPGIAFDRNGYRVGFGKGCYDRFLENIEAIKVGFCYGFQITDKISIDKYDIRMDYIVCENGLVSCE